MVDVVVPVREQLGIGDGVEVTLMRTVFQRPERTDGSNSLSPTVAQMMLPWEKA